MFESEGIISQAGLLRRWPLSPAPPPLCTDILFIICCCISPRDGAAASSERQEPGCRQRAAKDQSVPCIQGRPGFINAFAGREVRARTLRPPAPGVQRHLHEPQITMQLFRKHHVTSPVGRPPCPGCVPNSQPGSAAPEGETYHFNDGMN